MGIAVYSSRIAKGVLMKPVYIRKTLIFLLVLCSGTLGITLDADSQPLRTLRRVSLQTFHGKCIHVKGGSSEEWRQNRQPLWTWGCQNSDEFLFKLESAGSNYYTIKTFHGKCIHVQGSNSDDWQRDRQPLLTWDCQDSDEFLFRLVQK